MGINGRFGIDEKKVKRLGKNYSSIDFDLKENLTAEAYVTKGDYTPVGEFTIANKYFPVTIKELEKIEQTAKEARSALVQAYRLGLMH
jgi:hypothetical protein|tara:strand:- start:10795 stop:11058 length:264 start_codon:yes stop_codon:yes gene_type:complete